MILWLFAICSTICLFALPGSWFFLFTGQLQISLGCGLAALTAYIVATICLDKWRNP